MDSCKKLLKEFIDFFLDKVLHKVFDKILQDRKLSFVEEIIFLHFEMLYFNFEVEREGK